MAARDTRGGARPMRGLPLALALALVVVSALVACVGTRLGAPPAPAAPAGGAGGGPARENRAAAPPTAVATMGVLTPTAVVPPTVVPPTVMAAASTVAAPTVAAATVVPPPAQPTPAPTRGFAYGAAIADVSDAPDRSFALAAQVGFTHAYAVVDWQNVLREDGSPGRYAWERGEPSDLDNALRAARAHGLSLVIRLDRPHNWTGGSLSRLDPALMERFAQGVAARAAGVATAYEVLNEPNLPDEWGGPPDPAGYVRLLYAAKRGIRRAGSDAVVLAAGLSPYTGGQRGSMEDVDFLRGMYAAGASGRDGTFDALGAHAYAGDRPPELDPRSCGMCFRRVERYRRVMEEHGDGATPVWITEFGYVHATGLHLGPYDWMKVAPGVQAERLVAAYRYARAHWPWLGGMVLFNLDFSTTPWNPPQAGAHWFSLLNADRSERPALRAVREWLRSPEALQRPAAGR